MKKVRWASICLLISNLLLLFGCSQPPEQYVPRYSPDQVISAVRADFPTGAKEDIVMGADGMPETRLVRTPTQISVKFVGGTSHAWKATITCPKGYVLTQVSGQPSIWIVYFWETDAKLYYYYVKENGEQHRDYPPE
jgi:hypothetical protein